MKLQYQYIHFELIESGKRITSIWSCHNNKSRDELGVVRWYPAWRAYCYFPSDPAVYSAGCLHDIEQFISDAMKQHRLDVQHRHAEPARIDP